MRKAMQASSENAVMKFARRLHDFDLRVSSGAIGGLMLCPELQASTHRLEMLAHAAVSTCMGSKKPRQRDLAEWLTEAGRAVGHHEDPIEDVFAARVIYLGQNFRVLEGLSEGGCFHLQVLLNILEGMPEHFTELQNSCRAGLFLAEAICDRAGISPFETGTEDPLRGRVPQSVVPSVRDLSSYVTFSEQDLAELGVTFDALERFVLPLSQRDVLADYASDSGLSRKPILWIEDEIVVLLPTAIGPAIRAAVIEACLSFGPTAEQVLRMQHLSIVGNQLLDTPMIREIGLKPSPLSLQPVVATEPVQIDPGYWGALRAKANKPSSIWKRPFGLLGSNAKNPRGSKLD
jgi:hypothetical protein